MMAPIDIGDVANDVQLNAYNLWYLDNEVRNATAATKVNPDSRGAAAWLASAEVDRANWRYYEDSTNIATEGTP